MGDLSVVLRPVTEKGDAAALARWSNDAQTTRWMVTGRVPLGPDQALSLWAPPGSVSWIVERGRESVGISGLYDIDWISRRAEFRILLGEHRGEGLGKQVVLEVLSRGFVRLELRRIWLGTASGNLAAIICFQRCGFRVEARLKDDFVRGKTICDNIRMGLLRDEWALTYAPDLLRRRCLCGCGTLLGMPALYRHGHNRRAPAEVRFWQGLSKPMEGCWTLRSRAGRYARLDDYEFGQRRRVRLAHRLAWELAYGPIPEGLCICHHCDNPRCVRPDHLFLGTAADNVRDMWVKGRGKPGPVFSRDSHPNAKLRSDDVKAIRASSDRTLVLARRYSVSMRTIRRVRATAKS